MSESAPSFAEPAPTVSDELSPPPRLRLALQEVAEHRNKRRVSRRHRVVGESRRPHPGEALPLACAWYPRPSAADVKRHQQVELGVGMGGEGQRRQTVGGDVDAELFGKLANQRGL